MTDAESLEKFGTVSFGSDFMRQTIRYGTPVYREDHYIDWQGPFDRLNLDVWFSFVPETYQELARGIALGSAAHSVLHMQATEQTRQAFIAILQREFMHAAVIIEEYKYRSEDFQRFLQMCTLHMKI